MCLACPNFNKPFQIHTNASNYQLGAVVSQEGKPIAFCSRKLNPAQTWYTTTERELLSIVKTLKEYRNMLLGQQIEVFTDHKNMVYKHFNTERVMWWQLLLEEFGPKLTCVKGMNNIVADALSRLEIAEEEFSAKAFANELANEEEEFPTGYSLSYKETAFRQKKDRALQNKLRTQPELHIKKPFTFSDSTYKLITKNNKIYVPRCLQHKQECRMVSLNVNASWWTKTWTHHSTTLHLDWTQVCMCTCVQTLWKLCSKQEARLKDWSAST